MVGCGWCDGCCVRGAPVGRRRRIDLWWFVGASGADGAEHRVACLAEKQLLIVVS